MSFAAQGESANRVSPEPTAAVANRFGDVVCPHCRLNIITPAGMVVRAGATRCIRCRGPFRVSDAVATEANARSLQGPAPRAAHYNDL